MRGAPAGGCNFWHDPDCSGEETLIFWQPELLVDIVRLNPDPDAAEAVRFEPRRWPGRKAFFATADGLHMIVSNGREEHRLWLPGPEPPPVGTSLSVQLILDRDVRHRANAALKFCVMAHARSGRRPRASPHADYSIIRQMRMLQASDGRHAGATYRAVAAAIFGEKAVAEARPWKTSTLRSTVITLAETALALVEGGYLNLLRPRKTGFRTDT